MEKLSIPLLHTKYRHSVFKWEAIPLTYSFNSSPHMQHQSCNIINLHTLFIKNLKRLLSKGWLPWGGRFIGYNSQMSIFTQLDVLWSICYYSKGSLLQNHSCRDRFFWHYDTSLIKINGGLEFKKLNRSNIFDTILVVPTKQSFPSCPNPWHL